MVVYPGGTMLIGLGGHLKVSYKTVYYINNCILLHFMEGILRYSGFIGLGEFLKISELFP